ncbi:unnamed protein product, partial [Closterium sp. NIES-54]
MTWEEVQQPTPSPKLPSRRTTQGKRDAVRGGAKEGAAKERPKRAAHPRDFLKYERLGVPKALLVQEEEYEEEKGAEGEMEQICCFGVNLPHEPASMEEALAGDDREAWLASREDQFQSHMENETWTLTNLPPGRKALDCTWVLRVKTDAEGRLERRKTRLVIKGFQQREGIDFQEVFAPVAKAPTLRLLLAAAAVCGWKVEQMDVKTAFLYGVVDEDFYMKQPEGYDDGSGRVCRLNKAIYGLKQAPRCWYARLVEVLDALGFKVSGCDESLFMTEGEEEKVFLLVYVDDILLFSPSLERIKEVQGKLKETFQCKALGAVGYDLGLHVERDEVKGWLMLHQHKYLAAMGEKYGLEEGRSVKTPLPSGFQLHLDEEEGEVVTEFQDNPASEQNVTAVERTGNETRITGGQTITAGVGAVGAGGAAGTATASGGPGAVPVGTGDPARPRPYFVLLLEKVLGLLPSPGPAPPLECPQPVQSESQLQPVSPLPAPSLYAGPTGGLAECREPASCPASLMMLRPSTASHRVPLPSPPESSLLVLADPASDSLRAATPTLARLLSTVVTDPAFESTAASVLVAELVDFAARCRLDYAASLVAESASVCPPSVGGECALSTDVLEDRQEDFQCFAAALPHLVSTLIAPEGDPDAPDIPTPRSYGEAIEGPYNSQWQSAMDAEMASWKSTGTYVDEVPPPGANIVSGMWIFRVKRPPGSPPVFKARYVARGF